MFTTASITCSTRGAKESGAPRAIAGLTSGSMGVTTIAVLIMNALAIAVSRDAVERVARFEEISLKFLESMLPLWSVGVVSPTRVIKALNVAVQRQLQGFTITDASRFCQSTCRIT
jgi:hypothetical protein